MPTNLAVLCTLANYHIHNVLQILCNEEVLD